MKAGTHERRHVTRVAVAHSLVLRDLEGNLLARGKTTDISERGVQALTGPPCEFWPGQELLAELAIPSLAHKRAFSRTVTYRCRVIRAEPIADLAELALEFVHRCP